MVDAKLKHLTLSALSSVAKIFILSIISGEIINALNCECHMQIAGTICALEITKHAINLGLRALQFQNIGNCRKFLGQIGMPQWEHYRRLN